jgi:hypothetical protein
LLEVDIVNGAFGANIVILVINVFPFVVPFPLVQPATLVPRVSDYAFIFHSRSSLRPRDDVTL